MMATSTEFHVSVQFSLISFLRQVIIYSCTRSKGTSNNKPKSTAPQHQSNEILEDQRRLTVAITRAKHKLIMIGDTNSLEGYRPFQMLINSMSKMNRISLVDQQHGFDWRILLSVFDQANTVFPCCFVFSWFSTGPVC